jgi:hypothetical protein
MSKLIIVLSVLILIGVGIAVTFRTPQENSEAGKSIESMARRAKVEGKSRITVPGPIIDYPNMGLSLDEVLKKYSALVAEVAESTSFVLAPNDIRTAYKFRIVESLSQKPANVCETCSPLTDISDKLSTAKFNEFVLEVSGGTVTIDGVAVTMTGGKLEFAEGKKYLMLVSFTPGGMAQLAVGPSGVFRIKDDDSLESISNPKHLVPAQIASRTAQLWKLNAQKKLDASLLTQK